MRVRRTWAIRENARRGEGDVNAIARIHVASWQAAYRGVMPDELLGNLSVARREAGWQSALERGEPQIVAAIDDSQTVNGWAAFGRCRDDDASPSAGELGAIYPSIRPRPRQDS